MNRRVARLTLAGLILVTLGLGWGYWLGMHRATSGSHAVSPANPTSSGSTSRPKSDDAPPRDPKTGAKVLYWHDPMVPGSKFDKPGKSPFMDMPLVPVYADDAADAGKVSISPRTQQNLGIRIAEVTAGQLEMGFSAVGAVTIDERGINTV
ncbi:MAG TPA: heavy metal-binding domain-containing protein, partial [Burkholderiales bacterium]|nr:heavy metal-binding domain-containing protein [Burkholderiales bacterium]